MKKRCATLAVRDESVPKTNVRLTSIKKGADNTTGAALSNHTKKYRKRRQI